MKKLLLLLLPTLFLFQSCSKDFGSVEITYTKATAIYGDLDEIRSQPLMAAAREVVNPGKIFVGENILLIGEEKEGIHVIDNTHPANPTAKYFINIPGNREFYVHGTDIYAESYYDMVKIDMSNIEQPILEARVENAFVQNLEGHEGKALIGFDFEVVTEKVDVDNDIYNQIWGQQEFYYYDYANRLIPPSAVPSSFAGNSSQSIGSVNRIAYHDKNVYVISKSTLSSFSDEGDFNLLATNQVGWEMETIFPYRDRLFIGTRNSMEIFDVSNPAEPRQVSSFWHATSCDPVYPFESVAYVTLRTGDFSNCPGDENALIVLNVENLNTPLAVQEIEMESPYGLTLANNKLYVGEGENGLKVFDASNKTQLSLENWDKSIEAYDVIHHPTRNDLLLIAGPHGLGQYKIEGVTDLSLVSWVTF